MWILYNLKEANRFNPYSGSSQHSQSSHLHYHLGQPDHKQRSVAKGENSHFHLQNFSTTINKTHQQPMLRTHRVTSRSQHPSGQQKTSMQSIISAHFINREFKDNDDVEDFESYEDEEEEEEEDDGLGHGFMLKGGSEGDEESEEDLSSENDLPNLRVDQVNGFSSIVNKRLKTEHCKNDGDAEEAETNNNENEEDKEKEEKAQKTDDDDDPSEEMVVHVAPDEAILNAGSRESPPVMLIPQNRMPSPLRIGDRLACPLTGCDRSYRQMKQYISHMWTHRGIKPYRCTWADGPNECHQCQYMSEHPRNVIQHVRLTHFGIPRTIKEQRALVS